MTSAYKIIVKDKKVFQGECFDDKAFFHVFNAIAHLYEADTVMGEFYEDNYVYALCRMDKAEKYLSCVYYNDFDDYEDEIDIGSESWMKMLR